MASVLIWLFLYISSLVEVNSITLNVIRNASLDILGVTATPINGTCNDCTCRLSSNSTFVSFNCFHENLTCELYSASDQDKPFTLTASVNTSFYFISLPTFVATQSTDACAHEFTSTSTGEFLKTFYEIFSVIAIFLLRNDGVGDSTGTG